MLHQLVTGGYEFLPFARSRVAMLKKLGLPYADQSFEINGVSIKVRIEPGHEYISITGGILGYLKMDSGVVDVLTDGLYSPFETDQFVAGTLIESSMVNAYNAVFTLPVPEKWPGMRMNRGTAPHHQMAGVVEVGTPKFLAMVPQDGSNAKSFSPRVEITDASVDPPIGVAIDDDEALWLKKIAAVNCPASIFTGKCRLYVQAMYGLPMHEYESVSEKHPSKLKKTNAFYAEINNGGIPSLWVSAYSREDDTQTYPSILLSTSCGVRLDPATGTHWLFCVNATGTASPSSTVMAYQLISDKTCEGLRKYIKTPPETVGVGENRKALSQEDRDHLEAYILARCLPDVKNGILAGDIGTLSAYSMGYGWHWNWSGTAADIVFNTPKDLVPPVNHPEDQYMEANHYRITMASTVGVVDGKITATHQSTVTKIAGPIAWGVIRGSITIAEPSWWDSALTKMNPRHSVYIACAYAPFYAFYKKDVLQMCFLSVTKHPAEPSTFTVSPNGPTNPYDVSNTDPGGNITPYRIDKTVGLQGGYSRLVQNKSAYFTATINCAGISHDIEIGRVDSGTETSLGAKSLTLPTIGTEPEFESTYITGGSIATGYPSEDGLTYSAIELFPDLTAMDSGGVAIYPGRGRSTRVGNSYVSYEHTQNAFTESYYGRSAACVPRMDAEAIYLKSDSHMIRVESDRIVSQHTSGHFGQSIRVTEYSYGAITSQTWHTKFFYSNHTESTEVSSDIPPPRTTVTDFLDDGKMSCGAGIIQLKPFELDSSFWSFDDELLASFNTRTSASGDVMIGEAYAVVARGVSTQPIKPAIVGWA